MSRFLVVDIWGGLCSRMLGMATGQYLADQTGREFMIGQWKKALVFTSWLPFPFDKVFANNIRFATASELRTTRAWAPKWKFPAQFTFPETDDTYRRAALCVPCYLPSRPPVKTAREGWDPAIHQDIVKYLRQLQPAASIERQVEKAHNRYGIESGRLVGVQIRRTDHYAARKHSPLECFHKEMDKELYTDPSVEFFLSTDDPSTALSIKRRYGDRIIEIPKRSLDRAKLLATEDAYVDLLALAKSRKLIGSFASSFAFTASLFGGVPLRYALREN